MVTIKFPEVNPTGRKVVSMLKNRMRRRRLQLARHKKRVKVKLRSKSRNRKHVKTGRHNRR